MKNGKVKPISITRMRLGVFHEDCELLGKLVSWTPRGAVAKHN